MIPALKRHPFRVKAFFEYSLVLTFAFRREVLSPLLPPGLSLDEHDGMGFLAIALVQTRGLRPAFFPSFLGRDFFLSGYRIFARHVRPNGQVLRGLRILRSDADSRLMVRAGNALTHYNYRHCFVEQVRDGERLSLSIRTPDREADLSVEADVTSGAQIPEGSPFPDWTIARRFAGPLPFTFDYEAQTNSLVVIQGVREDWAPRPVRVTVKEATFLDRPPFAGEPRRLANAFYIERVPYQWEPGVLMPLPKAVA